MSESDETPIISFHFLGGQAKDHTLNFYDASRFLYGAARFIYTVEQYRQTGRVVQRLTEKVDIDLRISTPRPGSWVQDIIQVAAPVLAEKALQVPLEVLVTWVLDRVFRPKESKEVALKVEQERTKQAKEKTKRSKERTLQEKERTKQVKQVASLARQALVENPKLINALSDEINKSPAKDLKRKEELLEARGDLRAELGRAKLIEQYHEELSEISAKDESALVARARSQIIEVGKPLTRSASRLAIHVKGQKRPVGHFTQKSIETLGGYTREEKLRQLSGSIKSYDRETGWGKFRTPDFSQPIAFQVPAYRRRTERDSILEAMKEGEIGMDVYYVKDRSGVVRHLIFEELHTSED